jgi:cytochrome c peroxidase
MPGQVELVTSRMPAAYGTGVYLADVFHWTDLAGNGPRGLAISPDGRRLAAAMYFSGGVAVVDARTPKVARSVALGRQPPAGAERRGEAIFHDATRSFQQWLSCSTCHPGGRADGLNWDMLNDGIGSPKNTRSLLLSHQTPPVTWEGVRPSMEVAVAAGFRFILFQKAPEKDLQAVRAYIRSLTPTPSPHLVEGQLSQKARRGKSIFDDPRTGCGQCHSAPLFTNLKTYNVGTRIKTDRTGTFDTPTLIELWRTAPYLHHGGARTLREVFTKFNRGDRHGKTSHLSPRDIDALVEYIRSL